MKAGDTFPVQIDQWHVADAIVVDIDGDKVTLDIPPTRIVMGVKSSLADLEQVPAGTEHQILGDNKEPAKQAPNTTDGGQNDIVDSAAAQTAAQQVAGMQNVPPPEPRTMAKPHTLASDAPRTLASDDIGEGLANVALPEMD